MLLGEIFTDSIEMERVLVNGMDNLWRKLASRSFQFVVSVPLGTNFWPLPLHRLVELGFVAWELGVS